MRNKDLAYWLCTAVIAFVFASGGLVYLMSVPPAVEGVMHLGFPFYFVTLLGGVVILLPGFARVEEWAYAGMLFDLMGAAVASASSGKAWWHLVAPLAIAAVLVASWALRPKSCTLAVSIGRQEA